mmetsp:Transcript_80504/g.212284  ORF Transcript_80504/g.212284 Transcript_80504/m.212284 type:complete len:261 (-) Transcript_80504:629-1411(-)
MSKLSVKLTKCELTKVLFTRLPSRKRQVLREVEVPVKLGDTPLRLRPKHLPSEGCQRIGQSEGATVHDDDRLALAHFDAAHALLLELPEIRLEALNVCKTDVHGLARAELREALLLPSSLESERMGFRVEVDEGVAQVSLPSAATRQVQEIVGPVVRPLELQHVLRIHHGNVADHQSGHLGAGREDRHVLVTLGRGVVLNVVVLVVLQGTEGLGKAEVRGGRSRGGERHSAAELEFVQAVVARHPVGCLRQVRPRRHGPR